MLCLLLGQFDYGYLFYPKGVAVLYTYHEYMLCSTD